MYQAKKASITQFNTTITSRILLSVLCLFLTTPVTAYHDTWDGKCIDNNSFDWTKFVKDPSDPTREVNMKLYDALKYRAMEIPSVIQIIIDTNQSMYNDKVDFCPRSEPMPIKQNRFASQDARDVCFTVKVGSSQVESAFVDMFDGSEQETINSYRDANLKELVHQMKEFNFGNCLRKLNRFLFASYTQFLYTSAHYKFSNINEKGPDNYDKWDIVTPENVYLVREKLPGTIMDVINNKFQFMNTDESEFKTEKTKPFHDVIIFQMARALNIVHKLGFTHRDIKPDNYYIKKTVDRKIEVYLGEFHNSLMTTYVAKNSEEDHVSGSALFIPKDAEEHVAAQSNDLYQLALTMEELITHRTVEEVLLEAEPDLKIHDIANNSVKIQDKIESELELLIENHTEQRSNAQSSNQSPKQNKLSENNMSFNIEQLDFSYLNLVVEADKESKSRRRNLRRRERILETGNQSHNRRLEIDQRVLSGKTQNQSSEELIESYMTGDSFGITNKDNIAELNYNPLANIETKEIIKEAEEISPSNVLDNLDITTHSLPSGNKQTASQNLIDEVDVLMNKEMKENSVFKKEDSLMPKNEIQNPIELGKGSGKFVSSQIFLDVFIKNLAGKDIDKRELSHKANGGSKSFCDSVLNEKVSDYTELECIMMMAAKAITQRLEYGDPQAFDYFGILDPQRKLVTLEDVVDHVILHDRSKVSSFSMISMDDYLALHASEKYQNMILL